jgi:hypothetical protein
VNRRCDRNRKRSKRRAIYCPLHCCHLDSVSQKYPLFADKAGQLQERGFSSKRSRLVISSHGTVALTGEWLEAFWCDHCGEKKWYHVCKLGDRGYSVRSAPRELWQQVPGVIQPTGNPTVGEFTRRQARVVKFNGIKDFGFVR